MWRRLRPGEGRSLSLVAANSGYRGWRKEIRELSTGGLHALAFVIVPNLPYALLMTEYELRLRTPLILLYWCVGVIAPKCPYLLVSLVMAAVVSLDLVWLLSGLLLVHPLWVVEALRYTPLVFSGFASLYLALVAAPVATVVLPGYLVRCHRMRLLRGRLLGGAAVVAFFAADLRIAINPRAEPPAFDSAVRQSALERSAAMRSDGSLLVVMVENLGVLADPAHRARLF